MTSEAYRASVKRFLDEHARHCHQHGRRFVEKRRFTTQGIVISVYGCPEDGCPAERYGEPDGESDER